MTTRSLNLILVDYFLWGYLKSNVYINGTKNLEIELITQKMIRNWLILW